VTRAPKVFTPELLTALSDRFKALAEPARLQLLAALRGGERSVGDLVELTGLGQANVSRHLRQLTTSGFIRRRKEGTFAYYALADAEVFQLCDLMCGRVDAEQRQRRAALRGVARMNSAGGSPLVSPPRPIDPGTGDSTGART
jgi:ArsR family transcriptional regulator